MYTIAFAIFSGFYIHKYCGLIFCFANLLTTQWVKGLKLIMITESSKHLQTLLSVNFNSLRKASLGILDGCSLKIPISWQNTGH